MRSVLARVLACAALAGAPAAPLGAQSAAGEPRVAGRVLDRDEGTPLAGAAVRITAGDTQASLSTVTDEAGRYSLALPAGAGPFTLRAERVGYTALSAIVAGDAARAGVWRDLRLTSQAVRIAPVVATRTRERRREPRRTPGGTESATLSWARPTVPLDPGDLAGVAALTPGVQATDDGLGLSIFGQDPSQTRTTLDGASFGSTTLPQEALADVTVVTSAYDVSRGQYSGGAVEARTLGGTNLFGGALRTRFTDPQLQWRPGAARWPESTLAHAEGGAGGALVRNRLFWYAAFGAQRRSTPLVTLDNAAPALLSALGVAPDSAAALQGVLRDRGVTPAGAAAGDGRRDQGSALARLDWDVSDRHSLMLRLDGRRTVLGGLGADPLATQASAGEARDEGGGALAQLTSQGGAMENELRVYAARQSQSLRGGWEAAAGLVRVASAVDGVTGSSVLRFGGSPLGTSSSSRLLEISDALTASAGGGHQLKAGFALAAEGAWSSAASNRFGTFSFATLDDLRAGRPSLYTRTLGQNRGRASTRYAAVWLGDSWTAGRLALTGGVRIERLAYPGAEAPPAAPLGVRTGRVPGAWGVSPRLGWTWDGGSWFLRGGVGEFRGTLAAQALALSLGQTGAGGAVELACVGPAAPAPDWERYALDPASAPDHCADGQQRFAARAPVVTGFADDFAAPRTWHGSLGGVARLSQRLRVQVDASLTRGLDQPVATDRNLGAPAFTLAAEGGRPVYAPAAAIDPLSGGAAPGAARLDAAWGAVREIGSAGRSSVAQVSAVADFYLPRIGGLFNAAYTWTRAVDEVGRLAAPGGAIPIATDGGGLLRAASDRERRHDVQLRLAVGPRPWVRVGLLGRAMSGLPFTPLVDGDVNGDGARNDAAFVFAPGSGDAQLDAAMAGLLEGLPGGVRDCLRRQEGRVAARNGCRTGWTASLDLQMELLPWRRALEHRLKVSVTTANGLTLLDRALHGRGGMRGWGQPSAPDPVLLRVRGFDPAARAYRYEVNPGFGTRDASRVLRPFSLVLEGRVSVGSDPVTQPVKSLVNQLSGPGRTPDELRFELSHRIPNLAAQVLSADSVWGLALTPEQRAALAAQAQALGPRLAPLTDSLAAALSRMERSGQSGGAQWQDAGALTRRLQGELDSELRAIRGILTPGQWGRLPPAVRSPNRQLVPPRQLDRGRG